MSGGRYQADKGWVVYVTDECTCAMDYYLGHEQYCGIDPCIDLGDDAKALAVAEEMNRLAAEPTQLRAALARVRASRHHDGPYPWHCEVCAVVHDLDGGAE